MSQNAPRSPRSPPGTAEESPTAKFAHSVRPDLQERAFGTTVNISQGGIAVQADKLDVSTCPKVDVASVDPVADGEPAEVGVPVLE